jgi:hypothetical protein
LLQYSAAINAKGTIFSSRTIDYGLIAFTIYKMINWLTKQISKYESFDNKVKQSKEDQSDIENKSDYIRKNKRTQGQLDLLESQSILLFVNNDGLIGC